MANQIIEIEARSLEEARKRIKSQIPEGLHVLREEIISEGEPTTVRAIAETTETAFANAGAKVPDNAEVLGKKEHTSPERKVIIVEAFHEQFAYELANSQARNQFGKTGKVKSLKLVIGGRKGFLGIGKKQDQYEAEILQQAEVQITYRTRAKISATLCSLDAIVRLLDDTVEDVRDGAMQALANIGVPAINSMLRDIVSQRELRAVLSVLEQIGPDAVEPLIAALKYENPDSRFKATIALGGIGDKRAMVPLTKIIGDEDLYVRREAIRALGKIGDASIMKPLIVALNDEDVSVKKAAIQALGNIGDNIATESLLEALKDKDPEIRRDVAYALEKIGDSNAVEPLLAVMKDKDEEPTVRIHAVIALGEIGDSRALESLVIGALEDEHDVVRLRSTEALGKIGDLRAVEPLVQLMERDPKLRVSAAASLARLGDTRVVKELLKLAKSVSFDTLTVQDALHSLLKRVPQDIATGDLQIMTQLVDVETMVLDLEIDFSKVRQLAQEELNNRGTSTGITHGNIPIQYEVRDLRSDREHKIKREAYSGLSLGTEIDHLVDELVEIGRSDGFLSVEPGGKFDERKKHIRAREIGIILNDKGGNELMVKVAYRVQAALGSARSLEVCWGYIGEWLP